jgi:glycosyltransferase involved in cell wall biosynthesis
MKISIAMCTFNGSKYIKEQLQSIFTQSRLPDELIVCDDCSSDHTAEIVKSFAMHSVFPVYFFENKQNLGSTKNFEKAIGLCTGDIIFLSDQDDIWECRKIEKIMQAFDDNKNVGYIFTNAELVDENLNSLGKILWDSLNFMGQTFKDFNQRKQVETLLGRNYITGATLAFKADLKDKILPISRYWVHDGWIAILASASGMYGLPLQEYLIKYRQHSQQQIGVQTNLFAQIGHAQSVGSQEYSNEINALNELSKRLLLINQNLNMDVIQGLIDQKIEFLKARIRMYSLSGIRKWKLILEQISLGNYRRFTNSWRSIGRDLLIEDKNLKSKI